MNYTYRLHPKVAKDYNEGYAWYEEKQVGLGERFLIEVRNKINEILKNPEVYSSKGRKSFREANVDKFPYLIVYKIDKRTREIYITSIHNTKKLPRKKYRK